MLNSSSSGKSWTYAESGVDIDAGARAVERIKDLCRSTYTPEVLGDIGAFGGSFAFPKDTWKNPVLVSSTDGVGTKIQLGARINRHSDLGRDIVGHSINDILVQGAKPLFFLDYIGCHRVDPQVIRELVSGMSAVCKECGCVLIGGEIAEMPSVYRAGDYDLVGTMVGVVEREWLLPKTLQPGDVALALPSVSPHTNGFSLIRKLLEKERIDLEDRPDALNGETVAEALLRPHKNYFMELYPLIQRGKIKAMAHITGGGLLENPPRVFPDGLGLKLKKGSWPILPVFQWLIQLGNLEESEAYRVFNMGIGMLFFVSPADLPEVESDFQDRSISYFKVGEMQPSECRVELV